ncbi:hypothetical protein L6654_09730 [Bradyrhizobium sp. WYCCWR 13023]|uniref:Uncharacterized protein n=1 Tax=Bradyrhizobium zhengyangense TaxID=2911009 RepID=A0A9X1R3W9_9BRAD|nr:hypothetical protein [Bradyrhizobium zhengyangense]MCG2626902.1 hypothetical protein [Bradyrhizobium zhengyangense]MCG2638011.1 hypothetical protein [Bradyrhizobium zhengyangense]
MSGRRRSSGRPKAGSNSPDGSPANLANASLSPSRCRAIREKPLNIADRITKLSNEPHDVQRVMIEILRRQTATIFAGICICKRQELNTQHDDM